MPTSVPQAVWLCLALIPLAWLVALAGTYAARGVGRRLSALDGAGVAGQVKAPPRRVPNTGGVGIFLGVALPLAAALVVVRAAPEWLAEILPGVAEHLHGASRQAGAGWIVLACALALHVLGLVDDRKPLGPWTKLGVMTLVCALAASLTDTRLLTMLDAHAGGMWLSLALTTLWLIVIVNAMNFLDNMDGLSAGVGAVCAACFLVIALLAGQWFVGASLALLLGACLGFLVFNRPPASIFMGDGGSLVLGFLLAFLSVRITYTAANEPLPMTPEFSRVDAQSALAAWYATLTPLVVLAIPLYDFTSVTLLRISQGKSPFVGDLQHVSHRFVQRGLSKPMAVLVICGFAGATGLAGIALQRADALGAGLIACQVTLLLAALAALEFARSEPTRSGGAA